MNYNFKMKNGKMLKAYYNDFFEEEKSNVHGVVSFWVKEKEFERTVRKDETGRKFFTWDREKIYMDNFLAYSPEELVNAFNKGEESVYGDDLCHTLEKHGMDSLHLLIKAKKLDIISVGGITIKVQTCSSVDKEEDYDWVEYEFVEEYLRMPQDGYKLKVVPFGEKEREAYPKEDFYVCDLVGLISCRQDLYRLILPKEARQPETTAKR